MVSLSANVTKGTESETVPLNTMPGSTNDLTCPDSATYYVHRDGATTAQYYVNNQGVIEEEACTWGTDGSNKGNWAPTYFGVGTDTSGKTWLSIASTIQNNPQNYQDLNYNVAIVGEGLANNCTYSNGQYCGGGTCTSIADYYKDGKVPGCTVSSFAISSFFCSSLTFASRSNCNLERRPTYYHRVTAFSIYGAILTGLVPASHAPVSDAVYAWQ